MTGQRFFSLAIKVPVTTHSSPTSLTDVKAIYVLPTLPGTDQFTVFQRLKDFPKDNRIANLIVTYTYNFEHCIQGAKQNVHT